MTADHGDIGDLLDAAVREYTEGKDVAVAFSGGLDSGLIAVLADRYARRTVLYTVGSDGSYDVRMAEDMSRRLGMEWNHIMIDRETVERCVEESINITGTSDPVTLSFEIPLFLVCQECKESTLLTGQGADEMFIGYSKYVGLDNGRLGVLRKSDMERLRDVTLVHESKVAERFGKSVFYPFLDADLTEAVMGMDIGELRPADGDSRKEVLRGIAHGMGYPFIADKKKKAAQYGSGAMDIIRDICKTKNMTYAEWVGEVYRGLTDRDSGRKYDG